MISKNIKKLGFIKKNNTFLYMIVAKSTTLHLFYISNIVIGL